MKKVLLFTALSLCVSSAFAAETAVLKVQGTLTNAACTPSLSNGGAVDFGQLKLGSMSATEVNLLGSKEINLTITCDAATKVGWTLTDNRADSIPSGMEIPDPDGDVIAKDSNSNVYGLGTTPNGDKIGGYSVLVDSRKGVADGESTSMIYKVNYAGEWLSPSDNYIHPVNQGFRRITVATSGSLEPLAFKTASFPLLINAAIQGTDAMKVTDDVALDGQATVSLTYY